jgi:hypothetical protein
VSGTKEVVSLLQRSIDHQQPATGTLVAREEQLVMDLLRVYRNGNSIVSIEELLGELRSVRKQLHENQRPQKRQ